MSWALIGVQVLLILTIVLLTILNPYVQQLITYEVYNQIICFEVTFDKQNCVLFCRSHICIEYMNFDVGNDPIGVIAIKTDYTNSLKLIFGTLDKQTRVPFCISHICIDHIKFDVCNFTTVVIVITTDYMNSTTLISGTEFRCGNVYIDDITPKWYFSMYLYFYELQVNLDMTDHCTTDFCI